MSAAAQTAMEIELVAALLIRIRAHERSGLGYRVAVLAAVNDLGGSSRAVLMRLAEATER